MNTRRTAGIQEGSAGRWYLIQQEEYRGVNIKMELKVK